MPGVVFQVRENGQPVEGAAVYAGETLFMGALTNPGGIVQTTVGVGYAVVLEALVKVNGVLRGNFGPLLIEAGSQTTLEIGATAPQ